MSEKSRGKQTQPGELFLFIWLDREVDQNPLLNYTEGFAWERRCC